MMEGVMEKELQLNKSSWKKVKFGDVVAEPKESTKDIVGDGFQHIVGLEHIDSEDIHLKRSMGIEGETTFSKVFRKGDVLFGRRRAYLKKAALADFDGVCSGDITVFRAKQNLLPDLLPFLVNNERFFDHAIKHSAGGLSPRVKFKDLANYEFLLPPKEEQKKLADLLWAMDDVIEKEKRLLDNLNNTIENLTDNLFSVTHKDWTYIPLKKISRINSNSLKGNTDPNFEFRYLDISGILEPKVIGPLNQLKFADAPSRARRIVEDDSIVISMVRPYFRSFVYVEKGDGIIASTGTSVVNVNSGINARFVFNQLFSRKFLKHCENRMNGTNYPAITSTDVEDFKVGIPRDRNIIDENVKKFSELENSIILTKRQLDSSKSLQKSLINQIF